MSKKNLARTPLEGGRTNEDREWRRDWIETHRRMRHATNHKMTRDPSAWDSIDLEIDRQGWRDSKFKDKINAIERWIAKQVGRKWDDVYSEIKQRFDCRTTAGRHILYDHIIGYVELSLDSHRRSRAEFMVDEDGILVRGPWRRNWHRRPAEPAIVKRTIDEVRAFCGDRKVRNIGTELFWMLPINPKWWTVEHRVHHIDCPYKHKQEQRVTKRQSAVYRNRTYEYAYFVDYHFGAQYYVQEARLNDRERAFWNSLSVRYKKHILFVKSK